MYNIIIIIIIIPTIARTNITNDFFFFFDRQQYNTAEPCSADELIVRRSRFFGRRTRDDRQKRHWIYEANPCLFIFFCEIRRYNIIIIILSCTTREYAYRETMRKVKLYVKRIYILYVLYCDKRKEAKKKINTYYGNTNQGASTTVRCLHIHTHHNNKYIYSCRDEEIINRRDLRRACTHSTVRYWNEYNFYRSASPLDFLCAYCIRPSTPPPAFAVFRKLF